MAAMNLKLGNTEEVAGPDESQEISRAERKAMKKAQGEAKVKKTVRIEGENSDDEESGSASEEEKIKPKAAVAGKAKPKAAPPPELTRKER